jgi:hypothetical protein
LSPNHTNDLVHAEQEDSTDRVFEAGGAAVTVSTFDHTDMFSPSALTEAPIGNDDDSDIDCQVDNTWLMIILQESQEEKKDINDDNSSVVDGEDKVQPSNDANTRKTRRPKRISMWTDQDGRTRPILPRQTYWYSAYVSAPDLNNPQFHTSFC